MKECQQKVRKIIGFANCKFNCRTPVGATRPQAAVPSLDGRAGYDVVVLAGNVLINIASEMDYKQAQITFIRKAAAALRLGGHLYLDFQLLYDDAKFFSSTKESSYFEGIDDVGTHGRTVSYGSVYDPVTR